MPWHRCQLTSCASDLTIGRGAINSDTRHLSCSVLSDSIGQLQLMFRSEPFENGGPGAFQESLVASG